ncbi:MAG TPA: hypothetical protein VGF67_13605 [Ktedonobacteraceae bacterium]
MLESGGADNTPNSSGLPVPSDHKSKAEQTARRIRTEGIEVCACADKRAHDARATPEPG